MDKAERTALRTHFLARRAAFSRERPEEALAASFAAQRRILDSREWEEASRVGLYVPVRGEVETVFLCERALAQGRELLLPRCIKGKAGEKGLMEFARCTCEDDLVPGAYGIREPNPARCSASPDVPDLLIVPAVALDGEGYRLGYGGGYYDRLLARPNWAEVRTAGLIFSFQLVPRLVRAPWDKPLDGIATEKELRWLVAD